LYESPFHPVLQQMSHGTFKAFAQNSDEPGFMRLYSNAGRAGRATDRVRARTAHEGRVRPAGRPGAHVGDPRGSGRPDRRHPGRSNRSPAPRPAREWSEKRAAAAVIGAIAAWWSIVVAASFPRVRENGGYISWPAVSTRVCTWRISHDKRCPIEQGGSGLAALSGVGMAATSLAAI
jgi:hypothetical protein